MNAPIMPEPAPWHFAPIEPHVEAAQFWDASPTLSTIKQFAHSRLVAPWAVLGNVLAMVTAAAPPEMVLPKLVGGYGSLNLFIGLVAPSGLGKGAATQAAADLIKSADFDYPTVTIGTGEGIPATYVHRIPDPDFEGKGHAPQILQQYETRALFGIAEIDTLTSLTGRNGSTLLPELRKVWSAEKLGFQNRSVDSRLPVEAHSYRAAVTVGVQPSRAEGILADADGGTPQRFVWLPATDPAMPETIVTEPAPLQWSLPALEANTEGRKVLSVPDKVRGYVHQHRLACNKGTVEPLDTHALQACLKVAASLALLHRQTEITDTVWQLATIVMGVSVYTRENVRDTIIGDKRNRNRIAGEMSAERQITIAERVANNDVTRAAEAILRKLSKGDFHRADLRRSVKQNNRNNFDPALEMLLESGQVVELPNRVYSTQGCTRTPQGTPPENPGIMGKLKGVPQGVPVHPTVTQLREEPRKINVPALNLNPAVTVTNVAPHSPDCVEGDRLGPCRRCTKHACEPCVGEYSDCCLLHATNHTHG